MENIFENFANLERSISKAQDLNNRGYYGEAKEVEAKELYPAFLKAHRAEKELRREHAGDEQFELINYADKHGV